MCLLVVTLHRPSNVDAPENLDKLLSLLSDHANGHLMIFPIHPRTRKIFDGIGKQYQSVSHRSNGLFIFYIPGSKFKGSGHRFRRNNRRNNHFGNTLYDPAHHRKAWNRNHWYQRNGGHSWRKKIVEALNKMTAGLWKKAKTRTLGWQCRQTNCGNN